MAMQVTAKDELFSRVPHDITHGIVIFERGPETVVSFYGMGAKQVTLKLYEMADMIVAERGPFLPEPEGEAK